MKSCAFERERLVMDDTVEQAWAYAVEKCAAVSALKTDEHRLLCELGQQLGIYDMQLQLSVLSGYAEKLEEYCRSAASDYSRQSRLYSTCSVLSGLLLSILII